MDFGLGIAGLGMHKQAEDEAKRKISHANEMASHANEMADIFQNNLNKYKFVAKSHIHSARSALAARRLVEDKLIAALKAENANHPLASKEAVEAAVDDEYARQIVNPEVIRKTFPDGKLPDGTVVTLEDGTPGTYSIDGMD